MSAAAQSHIFLGADHERSERRTWWVIWLCGAMMVAEIVGGLLFGSIALVADGLHMSTHAGAFLLAALAYRYARKHANDPRFSFGTGKFGDLAGFTSAIILAMIALLIAYEAIHRLFFPVPIHFAAAIPIACLGLGVNLVSAWLLAGGHHHEHGHGHSHGAAHHDHEATHRLVTDQGVVALEIFEDGVPPCFRVRPENGQILSASATTVETMRPDGTSQVFTFQDQGGYLESREEIPEPHAFKAHLRVGPHVSAVTFEEHEHAGGAAHRDNNMRAAVVHVVADAAVSVLVIAGLLLAKAFGWSWMDPLVGIVGSGVIASWAFGLIRDTGAILLDMTANRSMAEKLQQAIEAEGDEVSDLHLWRLGPGHLGAIISLRTEKTHGPAFYRAKLARFRSLSHVTIEVEHLTAKFQ
ncbi:MAG TPA: CDF family Co(II)/Ni(II) efflux transporter DmeF [Acidocella sp.]|uniref:CDF family Co(II)/Ni(II) efflux transporter DmeF n=1 Tax=Acidocella sp. TaxID=50710 RepID=UPI002CC50201|nr:CDF family Co(II)/Ni(II) efflux transporter DmeF [Acidocella sp.]HVE22354.1 CDF family Co(II)/Ni(II) efflux transporter DmeF [Acidocella sp.]